MTDKAEEPVPEPVRIEAAPAEVGTKAGSNG